MAQKMGPTKVGSKKASKKPTERKDAHPAVGAKAAKSKHEAVKAKGPAAKAATGKAHAKPAAKPATKPAGAKSQPPAKAAHAATKPSAKTHAHKAPARESAARQQQTKHAEPAKAHSAPKHEPAARSAAPVLGKEVRKSAPMPPPARPTPAAGARAMPAAVAKAASQRIIAPASVPAVPAKPQAPGVPQSTIQAALKPAAPAVAAGPRKPVSQRHGFKVNEWIVYPAHGVGRIVAIDEQEIAGVSLELFVITFEKDKMTLRVPTGKSESVGMRKLAEEPTVKRAMETLKGRARIKRTMWSRRAQEYEAKINSGDLIAIAEVVRDLYRSESQPEQSYSERQLYEAALDRMAREIAAVEKLDERGAVQRITEVLAKSARGRRLAADETEEDKAA
jgi:CarD family transcriptional regulator